MFIAPDSPKCLASSVGAQFELGVVTKGYISLLTELVESEETSDYKHVAPDGATVAAN